MQTERSLTWREWLNRYAEDEERIALAMLRQRAPWDLNRARNLALRNSRQFSPVHQRISIPLLRRDRLCPTPRKYS